MLSIALIVKNEEKNLPRCLDSFKGLGDELVIIDTGSTDKTVEIAKRYTDKVFHFDWIQDFSAARNYSFSKCTQPWIMWLDADDVLHPEDIILIKQAMAQDLSACDYILMNYHYYVVNGQPLVTQLRERIVRRERGKWAGRCHETIFIDFSRAKTIDAVVWHMRDEQDRIVDSHRNIELMKLEVKDRPSDRNFLYLANELQWHNKLDEAIRYYLAAYDTTNIVDTKFQSAYHIAGCYRSQKKIEEAILWFLTALKVSMDYREPLIYLAEIYAELKDLTKAVRWLEMCLLIPEPKFPTFSILKEFYGYYPIDQLAKHYFALGNYTKSIEYSEQLLIITGNQGIHNDILTSTNARKTTYKKPTGTVRLNLGCGSKPQSGYTNCDLFPGPGIDEVFSLDCVPYADNSVDEIASEHALEHLPRPRSEAALAEWARVLKPGGRLDLKIPDIELCCQNFLTDKTNQYTWWLHTIYGVQDYRGNLNYPLQNKVNPGQIHYTGYTKDRITELLKINGFEVTKISNYDGFSTPSIAIEATKTPVAVTVPKRIAFINNSLNPRYLSYGDYWLDAFRLLGHQVDEFRYETVGHLPGGYDLYFFIEVRYDAAAISRVGPKVLFTQENHSINQLKYFDKIFSCNTSQIPAWKTLGLAVDFCPNQNHLGAAKLVLDSVLGRASKSTEAGEYTDIIIPSYKNLPYLQQTIESVRANTTNYRLIVANSGEDPETRNYLQKQKDIILLDFPGRRSFSQNINAGLSIATNDVVLLNNDVIVGKNWLPPLKNSPFYLTNPYSNCDQGWIHNYSETVKGVVLRPNMTIPEVDCVSLQEYSSPRSEILQRPWVAFYATYIRKEVIQKVGLLDENFLNGGEDYDYCRRAAKQGFTCGFVFSSFVFHFGGKTRKVSETENFKQHHQEDEVNNTLMRFKDRETVCIYTGPAYERWTSKTINTTGIGGSETCAALLAEQFAKRGLRSILVGDCQGEEGHINNVEYIDWRKYDQFKSTNYVDYFISSRTTVPLDHPIKNGKNFIWVHDIWLQQITHSEAITKFICLSPWHVDFFSQHHGVPKDRIYIQPNGLDLSRYDGAPSIEKDPYKLIYSSSPDRGLLTLLYQFPVLKKKFPKLTLHVFYGFENWEKAIKQRGSKDEQDHMNAILKLMKQDGVIYGGRISQKRLAAEQLSAALWVYPTFFTETFCLTAIESMYAGAVPITTRVAALETTVPDDCGIKDTNVERFIDHVTGLIENSTRLQTYRRKGRQHAASFSWDNTVDNWLKMFKESK